MTTKKFLSNKKTTQQTIAISPALREWIDRYINVMRREKPKDLRYKSRSAFYTYVLEKSLQVFEKGKTLDDFEKFLDHEMRDFLNDDGTSQLYIPYIEPAVGKNKYSLVDLKSSIEYFMAFFRIYRKSVDPYNINSIKLFFDRIKNRYMSSGLTKEINMDVFTEKGSKNYKGIIEHTGIYSNLHSLNCKMIAEALGFIGIKVTDLIYSEERLYYRMDLETTDLFFTGELSKKERIELLRSNAENITNLYGVINDKDYYLWMKLAEDNDIIINFKSKNSKEKWISNIERDTIKYGSKEELNLNLLKFFEKLHWIIIENENELKFQIVLHEDKYNQERQFLLDTLSQYSNVISENNTYYLS